MKRKLLGIFLTSLISIGSTSCNPSSKQIEKENNRVYDLTVIDIQTGDTIQIHISGNPGIASEAYKK
jgi:hypothetical protein